MICNIIKPFNLELARKGEKVKKEGWINLLVFESFDEPLLGGVYYLESAAKESVKNLSEQFKIIKTIKIEWEEEK